MLTIRSWNVSLKVTFGASATRHVTMSSLKSVKSGFDKETQRWVSKRPNTRQHVTCRYNTRIWWAKPSLTHARISSLAHAFLTSTCSIMQLLFPHLYMQSCLGFFGGTGTGGRVLGVTGDRKDHGLSQAFDLEPYVHTSSIWISAHCSICTTIAVTSTPKYIRPKYIHAACTS